MDSEENKPMFGLHFCSSCKNILTPKASNEAVLEFSCRMCKKVEKDFTNLHEDEKIVFSKNTEAIADDEVYDKDTFLDQTMPRVNVLCPECDWSEAVYLLAPDKNQTHIKVMLMCTRNQVYQCDHIWEMPLEDSMPPKPIQ